MRETTEHTIGYMFIVGASMLGGYNRRHGAWKEEVGADVDPAGPRCEGRSARVRRGGGAEPVLLRQPGSAASRPAARVEEARSQEAAAELGQGAAGPSLPCASDATLCTVNESQLPCQNRRSRSWRSNSPAHRFP